MDSTFVVGIDVGGQTSKIGVVDARGTVLAQTVIRTDTYKEIAPYIAELADVDAAHLRKFVDVGSEVLGYLYSHSLIGTPCRQNLTLEAIFTTFDMML